MTPQFLTRWQKPKAHQHYESSSNTMVVVVEAVDFYYSHYTTSTGTSKAFVQITSLESPENIKKMIVFAVMYVPLQLPPPTTTIFLFRST